MNKKTVVFCLLSSALAWGASAAQPCRDIRFKPLPNGLMRYGDMAAILLRSCPLSS